METRQVGGRATQLAILWLEAALLAINALQPHLVLAETRHVPADFPSIQACIDAAVSGSDECVVAPGTYNETINFLGKAITLRSSGGADVTTIDATGIGGSVVTCSSGEGPDTVLHGLTLTGGTGTPLAGSLYGGGMLNYYSGPTVTNCTFTANAAAYGGGMGSFHSSPTVTDCTFSGNKATSNGAGIYNYNSSPIVTNCALSRNTASGGGGMYNGNSAPTVNNCTFTENTAAPGGGMYNFNSTPTVTNCTFERNSADHGGGMLNSSGNPTMANCVFTGNTAAHLGGGIYNGNSSPALRSCTFIENRATSGGAMYNEQFSNPIVTWCALARNTATNSGGGMYNSGSSPTVTACSLTDNTANLGGGMYNFSSQPTVSNCRLIANIASFGGAMHNNLSFPGVNKTIFGGNHATTWGGGVYNESGSSPLMRDCVFAGNGASDGGGMFNNYSSPTIANCTFSGNTASDGGGMFNVHGVPSLVRCIFWGNTPHQIMTGSSATIIGFSDMQGGFPVGAVNGGGNVYVNPMFVRPPDPGPDGDWNGVDDDYGDLRLRAGSPCNNAGDPNFVPGAGEADLDGHSRVLCGRVDMGAYEFGIGDYDCNRVADLLDFAEWDACMNGPKSGGTADPPYAAGCEAFDFDADGDVDLYDYLGFQAIVES